MTENERLKGLSGWVVGKDQSYTLGNGDTTAVNVGMVLPVLDRGLNGNGVLLAPEDVGYVNRGLGYG